MTLSPPHGGDRKPDLEGYPMKKLSIKVSAVAGGLIAVLLAGGAAAGRLG
jgi:hypothetical protein